MNPIRHCAANLIRFTGRDRPGQFWPWAGLVLAGAFIAWMIAFFGQLAAMGPKIEKIAREHPDQVKIDQGPGHYSVRIEGQHPELMPDFSNLIYALSAIIAVTALLLAAAVVRRLHDSNMRGWIALVPLALLASGMVMMARLFQASQTSDEAIFGDIFVLFLNNLAYLGSLAVLVYLLIRRGTAGPNRFGEPPA